MPQVCRPRCHGFTIDCDRFSSSIWIFATAVSGPALPAVNSHSYLSRAAWFTVFLRLIFRVLMKYISFSEPSDNDPRWSMIFVKWFQHNTIWVFTPNSCFFVLLISNCLKSRTSSKNKAVPYIFYSNTMGTPFLHTQIYAWLHFLWIPLLHNTIIADNNYYKYSLTNGTSLLREYYYTVKIFWSQTRSVRGGAY